MMYEQGVNRRNFLKLGMAAGAAAATMTAFPQFSLAATQSTTLSECIAMSPDAMARKSTMVCNAMQYLEKVTATIKDSVIKQGVQEILANPAPTIMEDLMDGTNRKAVYSELKAKGFLPEKTTFEQFLPQTDDPKKSPHPFLAAPGSGYNSHHAYPGGLPAHTAANVQASISLYEQYKCVYDFELNRDLVIASQSLHDLHKPWVFQWAEDGESRTEMSLGGTGEHHVYSIAESIKRGLPAEVVVAQACAHEHPGFEKEEAKSVAWISVACILTGKDPVKLGLLAQDKKTLPLPRRMENFICHLGDHDWILTVPAAHWMIPLMEQIAKEQYQMSDSDIKGKPFKQLRNYVFSQASIMGLYALYSTKGKEALNQTVTSMVASA